MDNRPASQQAARPTWGAGRFCSIPLGNPGGNVNTVLTDVHHGHCLRWCECYGDVAGFMGTGAALIRRSDQGLEGLILEKVNGMPLEKRYMSAISPPPFMYCQNIVYLGF